MNNKQITVKIEERILADKKGVHQVMSYIGINNTLTLSFNIYQMWLK